MKLTENFASVIDENIKKTEKQKNPSKLENLASKIKDSIPEIKENKENTSKEIKKLNEDVFSENDNFKKLPYKIGEKLSIFLTENDNNEKFNNFFSKDLGV